MRIKIKNVKDTGFGTAWYMRDYLDGRTCEVLAIGPDEDYFVLHPITKKTGYWIAMKNCEVVERSRVPTWKHFLKNNSYGYSRS